ncbi:hypothetical protein GCM10009617_08220 [Leifsonia poae]|uniref:Uncharacterized protein n=1 Tax=Leifsonia poae TaxID=110933 RepID=A0A9W6LZ75_9MICO|nr:hypothetical protein GCM10017584_09210 [Leifsonia poae]
MDTWVVTYQEPAPRPFGVSDEEAIELCREWMVYLGATDALAYEGASAAMTLDVYADLFGR